MYACSLGETRQRRVRRRRRQLAVGLVLAALAAAGWGAAAGSLGVAAMTCVSLAADAMWGPRERGRFWPRAARSYLVGGTWAALDLILRYRLSR